MQLTCQLEPLGVDDVIVTGVGTEAVVFISVSVSAGWVWPPAAIGTAPLVNNLSEEKETLCSTQINLTYLVYMHVGICYLVAVLMRWEYSGTCELGDTQGTVKNCPEL